MIAIGTSTDELRKAWFIAIGKHEVSGWKRLRIAREELFWEAKQEVTPGLHYSSFSLPRIQYSTRCEDRNVRGIGKLFVREIEASSTWNLVTKTTGKRCEDLCKPLFGSVGNQASVRCQIPDQII